MTSHKFSGIFYFTKDFSKLEVKTQYVDIKVSSITYHRNWFPHLRGIIHNEFVLKSDQLTYQKYPRGLVVNTSPNSFVIYGGNWLDDDKAKQVLTKFGFNDNFDVYKKVIVEEYHKYLDTQIVKDTQKV